LAFYQRRILPRLIHFGMRQKQLVTLREQLVAGARGRVLEIGVGSGLNLPFYPREVEVLLGLDPSRELLVLAKRHASWVHFPVELCEGRAEAIPLENHVVDHVVMSWTLCSVADRVGRSPKSGVSSARAAPCCSSSTAAPPSRPSHAGRTA
jgi:ubiquinone/menaquinone biosynthesis C-methylase UbiE